MSPSKPDQASMTEWIAAMADSQRPHRERILSEVKSRTKAAYEAKDMAQLPKAQEIANATGISATTVRHHLNEMEQDGLVTRVGSPYSRWAAS